METAATRRYTLEEYSALDQPDDGYLELARGVLVREPRPGSLHGLVQAELARVIGNYAREHGGRVFTESGVVLQRDPPTVRGPDVAYYALGRLVESPPRPFFDALPDLVVEVLSPSDEAPAFQEKVTDYLEAGVRLVWAVDPERRTAVAYRQGAGVDVFRGDDVLEDAAVLPGLEILLVDLFRF